MFLGEELIPNLKVFKFSCVCSFSFPEGFEDVFWIFGKKSMKFFITFNFFRGVMQTIQEKL